MIDDCVIFNEGQFHVLIGDRLLSLSPSRGNKFFYLTVYEAGDPNTDVVDSNWDEQRQRSLNRKGNGTRVWPTELEKACGYWAAAAEGYSVLVLKTPRGERHISVNAPS